MDTKEKKNIVILGGGFGGLTCARALDRIHRAYPSLFDQFSITLIDRKNYHLYTPLLYEVAATASDDASALQLKKAVTTPFEDITAGTTIHFLQKTITQIDNKERKVSFDDATTLSYEYLIIALGSESFCFGIPGVKEHALPLKWLDDAIHIRSTIRKRYEEKTENETISIVIGGGGPAGVQLGAELIGYIKKLNRTYKKTIHPLITIVEGSQTVLPGFDPITVKQASTRLISLHVSLRTGCIISRADEHATYIKKTPSPNAPQENSPEEKLAYDVFIWGGGTQATPVGEQGFSKEKRGRIETVESLSCLAADSHGNVASKVFAIGDIACFYDPVSHRPMPGTARVAIEEAKIVAENIYRDMTGKPLIHYKPKSYTFVIPLGEKYAIAKTGPFRCSGILGWLIKEIIEAYYLLSTTRKLGALTRWWHDAELFSKND